MPGPRLFQVRDGGVALGLGRRSSAGVEQRGRERVNDGQHGLASLDFSAGFERDAPQLAGDRSGDEVTLFDAGLALLVDGGAERANSRARRLHRQGPRPQASHDQRDQHHRAGVGKPAAGVAAGGGLQRWFHAREVLKTGGAGVEHPKVRGSKSEGRRPKAERRSKSEIRNPGMDGCAAGVASSFGFRPSDFLRASVFGFRIWNGRTERGKSSPLPCVSRARRISVFTRVLSAR